MPRMGNLVLTRERGQKVKIGPDIWVTVLTVSEGIVRIGIHAPQDVLILRGEVADDGRPREQKETA